MRITVLICMTLSIGILTITSVLANDSGAPDVLRLSDVTVASGEYKVAVHVINDEALIAMDIPIQFGRPGDPIELIRVDFQGRVENWHTKHVSVDNNKKTVILGMIAELGNSSEVVNLDLAQVGYTKIADLVFQMDEGYSVSFETFSTERPRRELTFIFNRRENGIPYAEALTPQFAVDLTTPKSAKPREESVPSQYALSENFPNPFNPTTSFVLSLPEESDYLVRVYNVAGQLVKSFAGHALASNVAITWDGTNDEGAPVASGLYLYRASAGAFSLTRKMLLLK